MTQNDVMCKQRICILRRSAKQRVNICDPTIPVMQIHGNTARERSENNIFRPWKEFDGKQLTHSFLYWTKSVLRPNVQCETL